ncbi:MAG: ketopantoate reductase family protein [Trueperaceae bacterium]
MSAIQAGPPLRVAVVGAGAIGGTVGAYLVRAGHDVTFVDVVAEHVAAIPERGLRIEGPIDAFTVRAPAYLPHEVPGAFQTVFLCVKAHATEAAARALVPFLAEDGVVVSLQNGLNELVIAEEVGEARTMGCFVNFGADYLGPGVVHYGGRGAFVIGELDGRDSERLRAVHAAVLAFEPNAVTTPNVWGYLWSKLAVGAMIFATALTDDGIADCYAMPAYRPLFAAIAREVLAVAQARGVTPEPFDGFDPGAFLPGVPWDVTERSLDGMVAFNRRSAKTHSGVWRDLAVRKRKTEGEAQLGPIAREAAALGMAAPLVARILELVREVEDGRRERSRANLDLLEALRRAGAAADEPAAVATPAGGAA